MLTKLQESELILQPIERSITQCSEIFNNTGGIPQNVIIEFNNICQFLYNKQNLDENQIHLLDLV